MTIKRRRYALDRIPVLQPAQLLQRLGFFQGRHRQLGDLRRSQSVQGSPAAESERLRAFAGRGSAVPDADARVDVGQGEVSLQGLVGWHRGGIAAAQRIPARCRWNGIVDSMGRIP